MTIVADVDSNICELRLEHGIAEIAGLEVELLPKAWGTVWNVVLSIFSKILAVGIDNRGSVVINTLDVFLVNRNDHRHGMFLGHFPHQMNGGAVRNFFHHSIPARRLFGAEVRTGENFLHAQNLCALSRGLVKQFEMLFDRFTLDLFQRFFCRRGAGSLNQRTPNDACHKFS